LAKDLLGKPSSLARQNKKDRVVNKEYKFDPSLVNVFDPSDELCREHDEKLNSELGIVKLTNDLVDHQE